MKNTACAIYERTPFYYFIKINYYECVLSIFQPVTASGVLDSNYTKRLSIFGNNNNNNSLNNRDCMYNRYSSQVVHDVKP